MHKNLPAIRTRSRTTSTPGKPMEQVDQPAFLEMKLIESVRACLSIVQVPSPMLMCVLCVREQKVAGPDHLNDGLLRDVHSRCR
jgi:hypothetical protein